jgi:hypothetical protein
MPRSARADDRGRAWIGCGTLRSVQKASTARVRDALEWSVDPAPVRVRVGGVGQFVGSMFLELLSGAGAGPVARPASLTNPRVPEGADELLELEPAFLEGAAPWMPPLWAGRQAVRCFSTHAAINPTGFDGRDVTIPLTGRRVIGCHAKKRLVRGRHATAQWVLDLAGEGQPFTVTGPWLTLAWLGHLGGWPEPSA